MNIHTVLVDSKDREYRVFPDAAEYRIRMPTRYYNVTSARLVSAEVPSSFYVFSASRGNTSLRVALHRPNVPDMVLNVVIPDGNYTLSGMQRVLTDALTDTFGVDFQAVIDKTTYKVTFGPVDESLGCSLYGEYDAKDTDTDWGLAWYLGFDKQTYTGDVVTAPRVVSLNPQTYVLLDIPELNGVDEGGLYGAEVGMGCFSKIPFNVNSFEFMYLDTSRCSQTVVRPRSPVPRLDFITIRWRFHDGEIIDFNGAEHSFTLELTCGPPKIGVDPPPPQPLIKKIKHPKRKESFQSGVEAVQKYNWATWVMVMLGLGGGVYWWNNKSTATEAT